jgi:hypothetical protein
MVLPASYVLLTRARWLDPTASEFLRDGFAASYVLLTRARWLDPTEREFLRDGFAGFLRVANASPMA